MARSLTFSMNALALASLIYLSLFSQWRWVQFFFKNRFLIYTGAVRHGLYLLHRIPFDVSKVIHLDQRSPDRVVVHTYLQLLARRGLLDSLGEAILEAQTIFCVGTECFFSRESPVIGSVHIARRFRTAPPINRPVHVHLSTSSLDLYLKPHRRPKSWRNGPECP